MTHSIFYKFKNSQEPHSLTFDGDVISLQVLKDKICERSNLQGLDFDLEVRNAQTGDEYLPNRAGFGVETTITANTSLVVRRVPRERPHAGGSRAKASLQPSAWEKDFSIDDIFGESHVSDSPEGLTEEDLLKKVSQMSGSPADQNQFRSGFRPNFSGAAGLTREPPANYVCHTCGVGGHWRQHCPNQKDDSYGSNIASSSTNSGGTEIRQLKPGTGIPLSSLTDITEAEKDKYKVVYQMPDGSLKAFKPDTAHFRRVIGGGAVDAGGGEVTIPGNLLCPECNGLYQDPVLLTCCGASLCAPCVENSVLSSDHGFVCPLCEKRVSSDGIIPNKSFRDLVEDFKRKHGGASSPAAAASPNLPHKPPSSPVRTDVLTSRRSQSPSKPPSPPELSATPSVAPMNVVLDAVVTADSSSEKSYDSEGGDRRRKRPREDDSSGTGTARERAMARMKEIEDRRRRGAQSRPMPEVVNLPSVISGVGTNSKITSSVNSNPIHTSRFPQQQFPQQQQRRFQNGLDHSGSGAHMVAGFQGSPLESDSQLSEYLAHKQRVNPPGGVLQNNAIRMQQLAAAQLAQVQAQQLLLGQASVYGNVHNILLQQQLQQQRQLQAAMALGSRRMSKEEFEAEKQRRLAMQGAM